MKPPKPNQRKKWKKSVVQLVPVAPPPSQPENNEASNKLENTEIPKRPENSASEADIPLKLPRAMRSAASTGGNLLRERNNDQSDESVNKEPPTLLPSTSPVRPNRKTEEKENRRG